jgi:hypothetical protein
MGVNRVRQTSIQRDDTKDTEKSAVFFQICKQKQIS